MRITKKLLILFVAVLMLCSVFSTALAAQPEAAPAAKAEMPVFNNLGPLEPDENTIREHMDSGEIKPVSADRLSVSIPDGFDYTVSYAEGLIRLAFKLNSGNTNWKTILDNYLSSGFNTYVSFNAGATAPSDYTKGDYSTDLPNFSFQNLEDLTPFYHHDDPLSAWFDLGEMVPSDSLFVPNQSYMPNGWYIFYKWQKDNGEICYEYLRVIFTFDTMDPFTIPFRYISKEMLAPMETTTLTNGIVFKSRADGKLILKDTRTAEDPSEINIYLKAPAGAAYLGNPFNPSDMIPVENGIATCTFYHSPSPGSTNVHEVSSRFTWYGSNNKAIDSGMLSIYLEPSTMVPYPASLGWTTPEARRVTLENHNQNLGISYTYTESTGTAHIGFDKSKTISGDYTDMKIFVDAPAGMTKYRAFYSTYDNIMQGSDMFPPDPLDGIENWAPLRDVPTNGTIELAQKNPLYTYHMNGLTVFVQDGLNREAKPYGAGCMTILWYKDEVSANSNPSVEYILDTADQLCTIVYTDIKEDVQAPVNEVTCVMKGNHGEAEYNGWKLKVRKDPQHGKFGFHYELSLQNETGGYEPLPENTVFFIPYPKGHVPKSDKMTYSVIHYPNGNYAKPEQIEVTPTDYGLRVTLSSLSPVVLLWDDGTSLQITQQPTDQTVTVGQTATFTIGASDPNATYQWYIDRQDGRGFKELKGATDASYTTSEVTLENSGFQYYCTVTSSIFPDVTVDSAVVTLYVTEEAPIPVTGDNNQPMLFSLLMLVSAAGLLLLRKKAERV